MAYAIGVGSFLVLAIVAFLFGELAWGFILALIASAFLSLFLADLMGYWKL